jgi:hypothetical protein
MRGARPLALALALVCLLASAPRPAAALEWERAVAVEARVYRIPSFVFSRWFDAYTNGWNAGGALSVGLLRLTRHLSLDLLLELSTLALPGGNWHLKEVDPHRTLYTRVDLRQYLGALRLRWDQPIWGPLYGALGLGAGVSWLGGSAYTQETLPGCTDPVSQCGHWDQVGVRGLGLNDQLILVVVAHLEAGVEAWRGGRVALQGGLVNLPFFGLAVRQRF